jgi:hypothetical protein
MLKPSGGMLKKLMNPDNMKLGDKAPSVKSHSKSVKSVKDGSILTKKHQPKGKVMFK